MEIIQGDSYAEDFICTSVLADDIGYSDWIGVWAIVDKLGSSGTTQASGDLSKLTHSNLKLALRIPFTDTEGIAVGNYKLVVSVSNVTLSFKREIVQRNLKITAQGIR